MAKKRSKKDFADQSAGFGGQLGDLLRAGGVNVPAASEPGPAAPVVESAVDDVANWALLHGVRVRTERKGRRGKTVTMLTEVDLTTPQARAIAKRLGRDFGCGGFVEDGQVLLQGDHGKRVRAFLVEQGVRLWA